MAWNPYEEMAAMSGGGGGNDGPGDDMMMDIRPFEVYIPDDIPELKKLPESEQRKLMKRVQAYMEAGTPWRRMIPVTPNLDWYTPTCTAEDWQHKDVKLKVGQGIGYITLNRPGQNNTLNDTIMHGLMDAIFAMHARKDIRIVVFMAEGSMFSAGLDPNVLKLRREGKKPTPSEGDGSLERNPIPAKPQTAEAKAGLEKYAQEALAQGAFPDGKINYDQIKESMMWQTMTRMPQITIALVQGSVMSTGLTICGCSEVTVALSNAYFCCEDLAQGLIPAVMIPHFVQKLSASNARYAILSAKNMDCKEAKKLGLVTEIVDDIAGGHEKVKEWSEAVTQCGPRSVEACKELVNGVAGNPLTEKLSFFTARMLARVTISWEADVGMKALLARVPKPWEEDDKKIIPLY